MSGNLDQILDAVDQQSIGPIERVRLQRLLDLFGPEHVTMLARTIVESEENEEALIEPIISAVSSVMTQRPYWPERGLDWIAAFDGIPLLDLLSTMRSLEIFSEQSLSRYLSMVLSIKLARALEPPAPVTPKRVRRRGQRKATARKGIGK
jgi:hypothetical protein